jgi:hypothetical protein
MAEDDEVVGVDHANIAYMLFGPFTVRLRHQVVSLADDPSMPSPGPRPGSDSWLCMLDHQPS